VTLIFDEEAFQVSLLSLRQSCDAPGLFSVASYRVRSSAPAPIIRLFLEALNGIDIKFMNENVLYFSQLCSEFGFWVLSAKLSDFCNSPELQIYLLKSNVLEQAGKQTELNTTINRLIGLLEDVATVIRGLDSKVTEVMSDVTQMSSKLTQIDSQVTQVK
jgi:hypothetical protein